MNAFLKSYLCWLPFLPDLCDVNMSVLKALSFFHKPLRVWFGSFLYQHCSLIKIMFYNIAILKTSMLNNTNPDTLFSLAVEDTYISMWEFMFVNVSHKVLFPEQWEQWKWHAPLLRNPLLSHCSRLCSAADSIKTSYLDERLHAGSEEREWFEVNFWT